MRSLIVVVVLFVASCKKDEAPPADKGSGSAVDQEAADRAKRREDMMQGAHDRADRLRERVAEFDKKIGDAQAKLAAATNEAERKAAEAELRRLQQEKEHETKDPGTEPGSSSKGIDLSCANLPLGDKDPACKKNK